MANDIKINTFFNNSSPEVQISRRLMDYINKIVDLHNYEVCWIGEVDEYDDYVYVITKVWIPPQKGHATTTEFDADNIMALSKVEKGFNDQKYRMWGHSHVNMGVDPSSQDFETMNEFAEDCNIFIGMIHNKKGELFCWVSDRKRKILFENVPVIVHTEYAEEQEKEIKALLKERVSKLVETTKWFKGNNKETYSSYTTMKYGEYKLIKGVRVYKRGDIVDGTYVDGWFIGTVFFPSSEYKTPWLAQMAFDKMPMKEVSNISAMLNEPDNESILVREVDDWVEHLEADIEDAIEMTDYYGYLKDPYGYDPLVDDYVT